MGIVGVENPPSVKNEKKKSLLQNLGKSTLTTSLPALTQCLKLPSHVEPFDGLPPRGASRACAARFIIIHLIGQFIEKGDE